MAKKQSESSRPDRPIQMSAESIWSKPPNKRQKASLEAIAKMQKLGDATQIDYSDIPALTEKQLAIIYLPHPRLLG